MRCPNARFNIIPLTGLRHGARALTSLQNASYEDNLMGTILEIFNMLLDVLWFFVLAHLIMSWLINFQVLNVHQQLVGQIWYMLNRLLEPIYGPIRRVLPNMGGIDLSPLVVILGIAAIRIVLERNFGIY